MPGARRSRRERAAARRHVSFLGHTIAEYLLGAALVASGFHTTGPAGVLLVVVGALLVVLNGVTRGPLGALRLLSRHAHHVADLVVAAGLALSPLLAFGRLHLVGLVVAEVIAFVLVRVERSSAYVDLPRKQRAARARSAPQLLGLATGVSLRLAREAAARHREAAAGRGGRARASSSEGRPGLAPPESQ